MSAGQIIVVTAGAHLLFMAVTVWAIDSAFTGTAVALWMALFTTVAGAVLAFDVQLMRLLAGQRLEGASPPLRYLAAWVYLGLHGFVTGVLVLTGGFSLLGLAIGVMLAA